MTSIWVKFRFKKGNSHFNMGQVPLQHRASMSRRFVLSCVPPAGLGRLTVRVSFLSSSRARGRQDRTARLGRPRGARRSTGKTERRDVAWPEPLDVRGRAGRQDRTARRKFQERSVGVLPCRLVLPRTLPARSGPDLENCPCSRAGGW